MFVHEGLGKRNHIVDHCGTLSPRDRCVETQNFADNPVEKRQSVEFVCRWSISWTS
jgi:hypothetical protein